MTRTRRTIADRALHAAYRAMRTGRPALPDDAGWDAALMLLEKALSKTPRGREQIKLLDEFADRPNSVIAKVKR